MKNKPVININDISSNSSQDKAAAANGGIEESSSSAPSCNSINEKDL